MPGPRADGWVPTLEYYVKCAPRRGYYLEKYPGFGRYDMTLQLPVGDEECWWSDRSMLGRFWATAGEVINFARSKNWTPLFAVSWHPQVLESIFIAVSPDAPVEEIEIQMPSLCVPYNEPPITWTPMPRGPVIPQWVDEFATFTEGLRRDLKLLESPDGNRRIYRNGL